MELQDLLDAVATKGLFVRIWSQRHVRIQPHLPETKVEWWCELQHANGHRDSDHGGTAYTALANAFERAQGKRGPDNRPHDNTVPVREPVAPPRLKKQQNLDFLD